jgi:ribosome biogenesis GTPase
LVDTEEEAEQKVFERIENIAINCKFRNCDHDKSEGCAVKEAIEAGELTQRELNNYQKLIREREFQEDKLKEGGAYHHRQKQKALTKKYKSVMEGKQEK